MPRFSPNGKYLIWLERDISPPHHHVHRLVYLKWDTIESVNFFCDIILLMHKIASSFLLFFFWIPDKYCK
jgi:hypothetical protein